MNKITTALLFIGKTLLSILGRVLLTLISILIAVGIMGYFILNFMDLGLE